MNYSYIELLITCILGYEELIYFGFDILNVFYYVCIYAQTFKGGGMSGFYI